jgi:hypothetical protein
MINVMYGVLSGGAASVASVGVIESVVPRSHPQSDKTAVNNTLCPTTLRKPRLLILANLLKEARLRTSVD